ncbi:hypothetical protein Ddye_005063 [Dipteronia dyeriana]|uniref:Reverse transcriptase n=1 Tax=Dipteronia dyeriana TaxID=168575 RepID=A0AAD9XFF4_9ROSI|nr:hypothetical protein Ddye_005063 [Dipteronia dyeriana]
MATMIRRWYIKLEGLKDEDSIWQSDREVMKKIAIDYFFKIFATKPLLVYYENLLRGFPDIKNENLVNITRDVNEEEVKATLFSIGGLKELGPDGLPAPFYRINGKFVSLIQSLICGKVLRQIQDDIVVAEEILHKFKLMKGKKGYVAWKIGLAKAYDRL